jgi:hypothetical protein
MKYLVTFQDRITTKVIEAKSESEASVKAQKLVKNLLVISAKQIEEKSENAGSDK